MKNKKAISATILLLSFVAIYFYFRPWKPNSIHDDDLEFYRAYCNAHGFWQHINVSAFFKQFRPLRDFLVHIEIRSFAKNTTALYYCNVLLQSVNTVIFALIVVRFLSSFLLSTVIALAFSLSRFSFYGVTQLFNGGPLEGLAMLFFLLFLYRFISLLLGSERTSGEQQKNAVLAIFFAALATFTHERYLVLIVFIAAFILFLPQMRVVYPKRRVGLAAFCVTALLLNFGAKSMLGIPVLKGTGSTAAEYTFSPTFRQMAEAFHNAVLAIFQISFGPEYLVGAQFLSMPAIVKYSVLTCVLLTLLLIIVFVVRRKAKARALILPLLALAVFFLVPLAMQIRLELRWLQAPFAILLLIVSVAVGDLFQHRPTMKYLAILFIGASLLCSGYWYNYRGAKNLYFSTAARIGDVFDSAIKTGTIKTGRNKLYIWEKNRESGREGEINWALNKGYFFELYQADTMQLVFVDSLYSRSDDSSYTYSFPNFDSAREQIIFLNIQNDDQTFKYNISNLTDKYFADSLKGFSQHYN